jgi:CBS domain containing-hemolysin-like protein
MTPGDLFLTLLLIVLNGFFASVEAALAHLNPRRQASPLEDTPSAGIEPETESPAYPPINNQRQHQYYLAARLGWIFTGLTLGVFAVDRISSALAVTLHAVALPASLEFLRAAFSGAALLLTLALIAGPVLLLTNLLGWTAVWRNPEAFLRSTAPVMLVFHALFFWLIGPIDWLARKLITDGEYQVRAPEEAEPYQAPRPAGNPEPEPAPAPTAEVEMSPHLVDFGSLVVRQISVPRTEIVALETNATITEALQIAMNTGVTKLPVYENNLDQIVGIVHLRDLVRAMQDGHADHTPAQDLAREALFMPETSSVNDLLHEFRARHTHIAIVVEEYGGTYGLVTLEDVLEEIVGDVQDPFETTPPPIQPQADGSSLIDGMVPLEEVNEYFQLQLIDPYYDTIAGFILGKLGRIPQAGDMVEDTDNNVRLRVEKMDHLRIAQVCIIPF